MHFDVAGPVDARAIVLVHGSVVTRKVWLPQLRGLADAYRVFALDLPGHGELAHVPFTFDAAVQSVAEVIRRAANGRALVVGLSLGGYIAMEFAARHPALASGLVLSGCSLNFRGVLGAYLRVVSGLMRRGWMRPSRARMEKKTRRLFSAALADVAEAQLQAGVYPEPLGPAFGEMAGRDFTAVLARYGGPGLILNGERDSSSRRGEARFAAVLQPGRVQVVPDAGHACNLDHPDAYNQAVREFARSIKWD